MIKLLLFFQFFCFVFTLNAQLCSLGFEDFEGTSNSNPPTGWQRINSYIGNSFPYSGTTHAGFNTTGDQLILAPLYCPGELCFYWRASGFSSDYDMDIDYSIDNGLNWITVQTISLNGSGSPTSYAARCVDLPEANFPAPFSGVLIRFHQSRRNSGSFYLDDVCLQGGACVVQATTVQIQAIQPACLQVNTPFSVQVCATDASGNIDLSYQGTLQLNTLAGPSNLNGTRTLLAQQGCADFQNLSYNSAGLYSLNASDSNWSSSTVNKEVLSNCPRVSQLRIMSYNLLNFPNGRNDCGSNTVVPARWDTLAKIIDFTQPDILLICELQNEAGADSILNHALNRGSTYNFQRASFVANRSTGNTDLNNMVFYNADKLSLYHQSEVLTNVRDIAYLVFLINDPYIELTGDSTFLDIYLGHLKAGSADSLARKQACDILMAQVDTATVERNALFGGDFNFYSSQEPGYQALLGAQNAFNDPIQQAGAWNNNSAFSAVHTQSTRTFGNAYDCGASGGLDDRFDFILASDAIMNGNKNISYIPNSYNNLGNSGNLFNKSLLDPSNSTTVPDSVLNALYYMSDHLPVLLDLDVQLAAVNLSSDLLSFEAEALPNKSLILWSIDNPEKDNLSMYIQRSVDGIAFETIKVITSSDNQIEEALEDPKIFLETVYYRLMYSDETKTKYSAIKAISRTKKPIVFKVFPNPSSGKVYFRWQESIQQQSELLITNIVGQLMETFTFDEDSGAALKTLDLRHLDSGVYFILFKQNNGIRYQQKLILSHR